MNIVYLFVRGRKRDIMNPVNIKVRSDINKLAKILPWLDPIREKFLINRRLQRNTVTGEE